MLLNNGKDGTYYASDDHKCLNIFTLLQYLNYKNAYNQIQKETNVCTSNFFVRENTVDKYWY